jgi:TolA-binding protein|tara:strand:- start:598 stop:891 length:294 start_codon:yes stop_codon:yes gene_type:complete
MKLNEKSEFTVDLKLIILVVSMVVSLSATYFTLQADIEEAKKLPKMPISEKEFELKDALIRQTILNNGQQLETQQEQLNKIEDKIDKIDTRLYNLNK